MRKRLAWWELSGFLWTAAAGTLLHFVYEWSGGSVVAAVLGAVNESVWEHMKLLVMAVMLFTAVQIWGQGHLYPNLPAVRTVSVLAGTLVIPVMYYTLTGAFGQQPTWVHISIFFWAAAGMFLLDHKLLQRGSLRIGWM